MQSQHKSRDRGIMRVILKMPLIIYRMKDISIPRWMRIIINMQSKLIAGGKWKCQTNMRGVVYVNLFGC